MDRRIPQIQPTGIGAERRQHHARAVRHKAAAAQAASTHRHRGAGMQMPRDLAGLEKYAGLVTEDQTARAIFRHDLSTEPGRRIGIVIAGDPDPVRAARQT